MCSKINLKILMKRKSLAQEYECSRRGKNWIFMFHKPLLPEVYKIIAVSEQN